MAAELDREHEAEPLRRLTVLPLGGAEPPPALLRALAATPFAVTVKPPLDELLASDAAILVGREALLADALLSLRADPKGALLPVAGVMEAAASSAFLDPSWRDAADGVLDASAEGSVFVAALERLARVSAAVRQLPQDDIGRGEPEKRRIRALRWLATREIERLAPARSALSPRLHRWGALDAICGPNVEADLAALERAGLLHKEFADRLYRCECGDARLAFRDACESCRSTRIEMRAVLRHRCGHTGPSGDFWAGEELVCPSCAAPLAAGEYEGPRDEPRCDACGAFAKVGLTIATCLGCGETSDATKLSASVVESFALTEQGKVALLAVPGDAGAGDKERRAALLAAYKKLAAPPPAGRKPPIATLVRYTAVTASGGDLDAMLEAALRGSDVAVRVGGNSFLALLADTPRDGARRFVDRIAAAERRLAGPGVLPLTPATQIACWPEDTAAFEAAIRALEG